MARKPFTGAITSPYGMRVHPISGAYTIICVVRRDTIPTTEAMVVARASTGGGEPASRSFTLGIAPTTGYGRGSAFNTSDGGTAMISTVNVCDGDPHLLILTVASGTAKLYIDGVETNTQSSGPYQLAGGVTFTAGARLVTSAVSLGHDGGMDEVVWFGSALSAANVTSLYTAFRGY